MARYFFTFLAVFTATMLTGFAQEEYNPSINPNDFSSIIDNPYFSLPIGKKIIYTEETLEGNETVEILIPGVTKKIMGVTTLVYWDRVYVDGILVEDTRDYLAQDKDGNVWYFGENVDNYEDGKFADNEGSWIAGENGALPGIWFPGNPKVGDTYRQEYLKGEAEDMIDIISLNEKVEIHGQNYSNCVKIYDYTPLDSNSKEYKYYCKGVSSKVKTVNILTKEQAYLESIEQRQVFDYTPIQKDIDLLKSLEAKIDTLEKKAPEKLEFLALRIESKLPKLKVSSRVGFILSHILIEIYDEVLDNDEKEDEESDEEDEEGEEDGEEE